MMAQAGYRTAATASVVLSPWIYQRGNVKEILAGTGLAVVCSLLPDLDHERSTASQAVGRGTALGIRWLAGGHRMGTHSLLFIVATWLTFWWFGTTIPPFHGPTGFAWLVHGVIPLLAWWLHPISMTIALANGAAVGVLSHIWCDLWTKMGVGFLWPLSRWRYRLGTMTTGSATEQTYVVLVTGLGVLVGLLYLALIFVTREGIPWPPHAA